MVQVHDVSDGRKTAAMQERFSEWCRCLDWHPTRSEIALCAGNDAYVWNPSDAPNGKVLQHFQIDSDRQSHTSGIHSVRWMDEGRLLSIESKDGSTLVYNTESNAKELFRRTAGTVAGYVDGSFYGVFQDREEHDVYLSVNGDGKVRFWRTSVAAFPSWWEKDPIPTATEKKIFPETGKYVKIMTNPNKAALRHEPSSESWGGKGAALWTAE